MNWKLWDLAKIKVHFFFSVFKENCLLPRFFFEEKFFIVVWNVYFLIIHTLFLCFFLLHTKFQVFEFSKVSSTKQSKQTNLNEIVAVAGSSLPSSHKIKSSKENLFFYMRFLYAELFSLIFNFICSHFSQLFIFTAPLRSSS